MPSRWASAESDEEWVTERLQTDYGVAVAGEGEELAWILADDECGEFDVARTSEVTRAVATHFFNRHHRTGLLIQDRDFRIISPPPRCDLCGIAVEMPWWEHKCDPPLTEMDDLDGLWLVCDTCHELVLRKAASEISERAWRNRRRASPGLVNAPYANEVKEAMHRQTVLILDRLDAGRREELPFSD
jgi:hypothetical protein